jgi:hypothetical protein
LKHDSPIGRDNKVPGRAKPVGAHEVQVTRVHVLSAKVHDPDGITGSDNHPFRTLDLARPNASSGY